MSLSGAITGFCDICDTLALIQGEIYDGTFVTPIAILSEFHIRFLLPHTLGAV